jgi:hypothetical protein
MRRQSQRVVSQLTLQCNNIASSCIFIVGVCFTGKIIISISSLHEKITKIIDTVYRAVNFKMKNTSD